MELQTSKFESSETLASFLASTPLLEESWKLCSRANVASPQRFVVDHVGEVAYVAFSGVQRVVCSEESWRSLVDLESGGGKEIFSAFPVHVEGRDEPVMVHGGLLQLFLCFYQSQDFQQKMLEILNECKSVVFTGHSLGGPLASLAALWLLSFTHTTSHSIAILCITYGAVMLGNESFSQAILQERWSGNFCHIVSQHDIVPRIPFAPSSPIYAQLGALLQFLHFSMTSPYFLQLGFQLPEQDKVDIFQRVLACLEARFRGGEGMEISPYCPFGSYMFCTENGAICLDNRKAIVDMLYLMLAKGSPSSCIEDHLKYGEYVGKICWQYLLQKGISCTEERYPESSSEAGIALALQSSGISYQEQVYEVARNSLAVAGQSGCRQNLNNAKMAVSLAKITPLRAEIEWFKAFCENSDDQLGYYDSFKQRGASRRGSRVNMNRERLGQFWDDLIDKLETNKLTHDFHKLPKYVNASHFYKLLVEPLEIAEYYRTCMHKKKGHYIEHGREKRFNIFDKWWKDRKVGNEEGNPRSKFAGLTQDSCFWARVEEARDCIFHVMGEMDLGRRMVLLDKIEKFEQYASGMVERKEVSIDVLLKNSSYNMFREEWRDLKSQLHQLPKHFPGMQDGMVQ